VSAMGRMLLRAQTRRESVHGLPAWLVPAFIVAVLALALSTWIGWSLRDPALAFPAMLSVLVASCPCALSLALPAVYAAASQRLLNEGVMLTRGDALKALCQVDTVVFDKTGTLTQGHPLVSRVHLNPERTGFSRERALEIAGRIESASAHPLARAFPRPSGVPPDVRVVAGKGIEASVDGRHWRLGQAVFAEPGIQVDSEQAEDTEIWLADDNGWLARFTLRDSLRTDAKKTVSQLAADGLEISILSGDGEAAVKRVAEQTGIEDWQARQSPENKQQKIESMHHRGQSILMVGDGVNDAPVLAAADASMTVKGGSELANSVADMILTGDSLMLVVTARDIAKQSQALIHQNLAWALLYNVSVLPLAVSGILQPWMAALGMSLSSLVVVVNATRLVRRKNHQWEEAYAT